VAAEDSHILMMMFTIMIVMMLVGIIIDLDGTAAVGRRRRPVPIRQTR
jgi:hypothetical protein